MDQAIKRKWVKALRSGKYRQGRDCLKAGGAFSCLGVLCDIQGADWKKVEDLFGGLKTYDLPRQFNAGLRKTQRQKLARMNDGRDPDTGFRRHRFNEIADYIQKNL